MPPPLRTFIAALLLSLSLISPSPLAAEPGLSLERGDPPTIETDRSRLAKNIYTHTFENFRDPDTGRALPESAALNPNNWPDFWEPIRAVGYPEYLIPTIRIAEDKTNFIPGAYRDVPNHALIMEFDGTRVGIRTTTPVPVDPDLAYQYAIMLKDDGLQGARIRTGIEWMRIDPTSTSVLRTDETPGLTPGQTDWPVVPFTMLVNDPPAQANAARLFVIVDNDPQWIGGSYRGSITVDNIVLKPLPKVLIEPPRPAPDGDGRIVPVRYNGLIDNIPDPENPGYFKGGIYSRRVEITNVYGEPITIDLHENERIVPDETGTAIEEIPFPRYQYGVYYFNIRLYDGEGGQLTDVIRSVAIMKPETGQDGPMLRSAKPLFGVDAGAVPSRILARRGLLKTILQRTGVKLTKITPWLDSYGGGTDNDTYYDGLVEETRNLRLGGISVTGVVAPPARMFDNASLASALATAPQRMNDILAEAGRRLGLYIDSWQMGRDDDASFASISPGRQLDAFIETLREFAGGMPMTANVDLSADPVADFPVRPDSIQAFLPDTTAQASLWPRTAPVFPWLFEPYYRRRGSIYPPEDLSALAPPPPNDKLEEEARLAMRTGSWISLEMPPSNPQEPHAAAERVQLEEMMIRAVYASAIAPDGVFLGSLFDPARGMLRRDVTGANTLETMARPTFLAARVLAEFLESSQYLGRLWLLPPFEAHVFRKPGTDAGVIAIWHNDAQGVKTLARAEIAAGPPLEQVDWAGNRSPVDAAIQVRRIPSFILGMPASLLLTRMSMRVAPEPPILAMNRRQSQNLEVVNHMTRQAPILLRMQYAARMPGGTMENNWMLQPKEMRLNLRPVSADMPPTISRFDVTPDPNSQIQIASPTETDKSGLKIARAAVTVNTSPPADMTVYLPFRLRSDLDVDIEVLARENDPFFVTLQLKMRWFPSGDNRRRGELRLMPYYIKRGQMKETAPFPIVVKAQDIEQRGNPDALFDTVEVRIPKRPRMQTWVGLEEAGGSRFYIADVTQFLDVLDAQQSLSEQEERE